MKHGRARRITLIGPKAQIVAGIACCALLAACATGPAKTDHAPDSPLVRSTAEILSLHPEQGYITVETDGKTRIAWWDRHTQFWRDGERSNGWNPRPGEHFKFKAFDLTGELYLYVVMQ
jgi:hypothetical protein